MRSHACPLGACCARASSHPRPCHAHRQLRRVWSGWVGLEEHVRLFVGECGDAVARLLGELGPHRREARRLRPAARGAHAGYFSS
eukprot:scaffold602_cov121-Isochrysis_galbana.AAC.1